MIEHDDWQLGDEGEGGACPVCGKRNRPGQVRCAICGSPLDAEPEPDAGPLRTIGEAMVGAGSRRPRRRRERPWHWPAAAIGFLAVVAGLYWIGTRDVRELPLPDFEPPVVRVPTAAEPAAAPAVASVPGTAPAEVAPVAERAAEPGRRTDTVTPDTDERRAAASRPRAAAPARRTEAVPARPEAAPARRPAEQAARVPPPVAEPPPAVAAPPRPAGLREKPSLGTDLVEARRAYAAAIERYNARADAYNAIADAYQRRDLRVGSDEERHLRARLEGARDAAERARAEAEALRARMEEVQARYR